MIDEIYRIYSMPGDAENRGKSTKWQEKTSLLATSNSFKTIGKTSFWAGEGWQEKNKSYGLAETFKKHW